MRKEHSCHREPLIGVVWFLLVTLLLRGCSRAPAYLSRRLEPSEQKVLVLREISADQGKAFLSQLGLGTVSTLSDRNALLVTGSHSELRKASAVLELVDANEEFVIETLGPASMARTLPSNGRLAQALGDITIGTFADPPQHGRHARAIIDVHGDAVLAIVPARCRQETLTAIELGPEAIVEHKRAVQGYIQADTREALTVADQHPTDANLEQGSAAVPPAASKDMLSRTATAQLPPQLSEPGASKAKSGAQVKAGRESIADTEEVFAEEHQAIGKGVSVSGATVDSLAQPNSEARETTAKPSGKVAKPPTAGGVYQIAPLANGDDTLELDLPEKMDLTQLLDLAGEYLHLDYMYDPDRIKSQMVTLKLHGKLQGRISVNDLYPLLESVLRFKGFAMTRHKGNLVTIVPVTDALEVDPKLVDPNSKIIEAGDIVVTRIFELHYMDTAGATNLLENMRLSVAVSAVEESQTLIVTCYAHLISRIERLLSMIDRPGMPRKFRFRQLKYTMSKTLAKKVEALAKQLRTVPVTIASAEKAPLGPSQQVSVPPPPSLARRSKQLDGSEVPSRETVYLDSDERTNRILIIGYEEQLVIVDELIEALDVAQQDLRTLSVYNVKHLNADQVKRKLQELEIIGKAAQTSRTFATAPTLGPSPSTRTGMTDAIEGPLVEEPQVVVLATTNSLLINATEEQHARIETIISFVDVAPQDLRTLRVYEIEHIDADEMKRKLQELEIAGRATLTAGTSRMTPTSGLPPSATTSETRMMEGAAAEEPQVVVLAATNSLLINATEEQHAQIATIIGYVDTESREQAIPYEIYFLENQEPNRLAGVLEKIIRETITDKEAKIEKVIQREEQIVLVPDEATFSLIVYANKKNQGWINKLVKTLDRRRPQVLIDVTLVEIRKTDEFDYDLNLITSFPDLVETGGQTGSFLVDKQTVVEKLLQPGMREQFIDFQANAGLATGFYADRHVNALLHAMRTKNYGRVLAKPKVLVNDNQTGTIKTMDTTYVTKKTSIPVITGAAGQQSTLIETAIDYQSYEAGITLGITPHISEGDLLRLEVTLTRSDFGTITGEKPPDKTSSDVNTVVTIPDGSTIILGGMLKLNQSRGGAKVPILGDLPLIGLLFRSLTHSDIQSKLYVFVRAEIIRPAEALAAAHTDIERISGQNRAAFEKHEEEFQNYHDVPGLKPRIMDPAKVLEAR